MAVDHFLGDASLADGIAVPVCGECGRDMEPKVFFGHVYGWTCRHSDEMEVKSWSMNEKAH